jgi:hypothetical protein
MTSNTTGNSDRNSTEICVCHVHQAFLGRICTTLIPFFEDHKCTTVDLRPPSWAGRMEEILGAKDGTVATFEHCTPSSISAHASTSDLFDIFQGKQSPLPSPREPACWGIVLDDGDHREFVAARYIDGPLCWYRWWASCVVVRTFTCALSGTDTRISSARSNIESGWKQSLLQRP